MTACTPKSPAAPAPSSAVTPEQLAGLVAAWESLDHLPLANRIVAFVRQLRARGMAAYAKPAHYVAANAEASATAATFELRLDRGGLRSFAICSIGHPAPGTADILCSRLQVRGFNHIDSTALVDAWCDDDTSPVEAPTDESPRALPHPLLIAAGGTFEMFVTGSSINTTGIAVRGFHIDDVTYEVLRAAGELWVEGFNTTFSAAAVMSGTIDRLLNRSKRATHLVAKETLTGDAVRANINFLVKGERLFPKEGKIIPPLSLRKAMALFDCDFAAKDSIRIDKRYTSAGGAGTAKLQITMLGRRQYGG